MKSIITIYEITSVNKNHHHISKNHRALNLYGNRELCYAWKHLVKKMLSDFTSLEQEPGK